MHHRLITRPLVTGEDDDFCRRWRVCYLCNVCTLEGYRELVLLVRVIESDECQPFGPDERVN